MFDDPYSFWSCGRARAIVTDFSIIIWRNGASSKLQPRQHSLNLAGFEYGSKYFQQASHGDALTTGIGITAGNHAMAALQQSLASQLKQAGVSIPSHLLSVINQQSALTTRLSAPSTQQREPEKPRKVNFKVREQIR